MYPKNLKTSNHPIEEMWIEYLCPKSQSFYTLFM